MILQQSKRVGKRARRAVAALLSAMLLVQSGCAASADTGARLKSDLGAQARREQLGALTAGLEVCLRGLGFDSAPQGRLSSDLRIDGMTEAAQKRRRKQERVYFGPEGTAGRLVIPSAGINVAVNLPGEDAQATADEADSACWMEYGPDQNPVIGDHVNQDFSALLEVKPGDVCTIVKNGAPYEYRCVRVGYGSNIETDVLDGEGESIFRYGGDRLCMYTCANGWRHVFIAEWQCESDPPLRQPQGAVLIEQSEPEDEG